jgi:hypothetical protein
MPQTHPPSSGDRTGQNEYNPHESPADLIIGIDFGTTFTGVAYAFAGKQVLDKAKIADKVIVIKKWPGAADKEKIPTVLSYSGTYFLVPGDLWVRACGCTCVRAIVFVETLASVGWLSCDHGEWAGCFGENYANRRYHLFPSQKTLLILSWTSC